MRVLLAPDKFKGSFSAREICEHLRSGILEAHPSAEVISHPLADGGDGTLQVLLDALGGVRISIAASGPRGGPLWADVGRLPDGTIVIESALFCGLELLPPAERNPMATTTYGLGLALREVASWSPPKVLVGLGGSATVDGGLGVARAFGFRLQAEDGSELAGAGADLERLAAIVAPAGREAAGLEGRLRALCDVRNPLVGAEGAAEVFASQKGATPEGRRRLRAGLERVARIIERDLGVRVADLPGGGSAGGLGAGLHAFLGAEIVPGTPEILTLTHFDKELEGADLVVTGEGALDLGSLRGKVVQEVVGRSMSRGIPVAVVCGRCEAGIVPSGVQLLCSTGFMDAGTLREVGRKLI